MEKKKTSTTGTKKTTSKKKTTSATKKAVASKKTETVKKAEPVKKAETKKKKKNNDTIWLILIAMVIIYLVCKVGYIGAKKVDTSSLNVTFGDNITVEYKETNNVLTYDDFTIGNFFSDFVKSNDNSMMYKQNGDNTSVVRIGEGVVYVDIVSQRAIDEYDNDEENPLTVDPEVKEYFEKNNINNDVDLINLLRNTYPKNSTIFETFKQIEVDHVINGFLVAADLANNIRVINGSVNGYALYYDNGTVEIQLINGSKEKVEIILSGKDVTTDEFITNLLQTAKFN